MWGDRPETAQSLRAAGQNLNGPDVKRQLFKTSQASAVDHR